MLNIKFNAIHLFIKINFKFRTKYFAPTHLEKNNNRSEVFLKVFIKITKHLFTLFFFFLYKE